MTGSITDKKDPLISVFQHAESSVIPHTPHIQGIWVQHPPRETGPLYPRRPHGTETWLPGRALRSPPASSPQTPPLVSPSRHRRLPSLPRGSRAAVGRELGSEQRVIVSKGVTREGVYRRRMRDRNRTTVAEKF